MRSKPLFFLLPALLTALFFGCDATSTGHIKVVGPVSGDNTAEVKDYDNGGSFNFGGLPKGGADRSVEFTIINDNDDSIKLNGTVPIEISSDNNRFELDGDQPAAFLEGGTRTTFKVKFKKSDTLGSEEGIMTIATDDKDFGTYRLNLAGAVVLPGPSIEVRGPIGEGTINHNNFDSTETVYSNNYGLFINMDADESGPVARTVTITIKNTGGSDLTINNLPLSVTGDDASVFTIEEQPISPIPANTEATFKLRYTYDSHIGDNNVAQLDIESNDPDLTTFTLALTGTYS